VISEKSGNFNIVNSHVSKIDLKLRKHTENIIKLA